MVRFYLGAAFLIGSLFSAETAPATAGNLVLSPTSEWNLRAYDDKCRASRTFGSGEDEITLWLDQGGSEPAYNLTLLGEPFKHISGAAVWLKPGSEAEIIRSYVKATSSKGRPVLRMYGLTLVQPSMEKDGEAERPDIDIGLARAGSIEKLRINAGRIKPVELLLGPMSAQFAFLSDCGRRLQFNLSATTRLISGEARPPKPIGAENWVQSSDWPDYLWRAEMEGNVTARLTVGKDGQPSSCIVLGSNKPQLFDDAVCLSLMKRAKFEPALGEDGEAIASYFNANVMFRFE